MHREDRYIPVLTDVAQAGVLIVKDLWLRRSDTLTVPRVGLHNPTGALCYGSALLQVCLESWRKCVDCSLVVSRCSMLTDCDPSDSLSSCYFRHVDMHGWEPQRALQRDRCVICSKLLLASLVSSFLVRLTHSLWPPRKVLSGGRN